MITYNTIQTMNRMRKTIFSLLFLSAVAPLYKFGKNIDRGVQGLSIHIETYIKQQKNHYETNAFKMFLKPGSRKSTKRDTMPCGQR